MYAYSSHQRPTDVLTNITICQLSPHIDIEQSAINQHSVYTRSQRLRLSLKHEIYSHSNHNGNIEKRVNK